MYNKFQVCQLSKDVKNILSKYNYVPLEILSFKRYNEIYCCCAGYVIINYYTEIYTIKTESYTVEIKIKFNNLNDIRNAYISKVIKDREVGNEIVSYI